MTQKEVFQQIECATTLVSKWPDWKQNILAHSESPTVSVPRTPIINQLTVTDQQKLPKVSS